MRHEFVWIMLIIWLLTALGIYYWTPYAWVLVLLVPLTGLGIYDIAQSRHALWRNFPVIGHGRWIMEAIRPFLRQYFFESETDGVPISRMFRSVIYQRAKGQLDSVPYGTKVDTQRIGYEWIGHSMAAIHLSECAEKPAIVIGNSQCTKPYAASIFNISAMSYGALSNNAIRALNKGARKGGFYHNTGEGSVSPYHLEHGGDLVWQIGTGYFGCRTEEGDFCPDLFKKTATHDAVKMIELKMSQGAKPGHGGILPAEKNTQEIARIRHVKAATQVDSPPAHRAFKTPIEMMQFLQTLRELSGGKPVGFKLAVGRTSELVAICKAIQETGIKPDFITVDGGEGGTGAAPLEYTNSVGMPLREALVCVTDILAGFNLKQDIRVIASGKTFTGFHIVKNLALGADICNSARGMMMALGCVQSLVCNTNECPTGIATQDAELVKGLVVSDKAERVARYHDETVRATMEIVASAGLRHPHQLNRTHIFRRTSQTEIHRYDEIYPSIKPGSFLTGDIPARYRQEMQEASPNTFMPQYYVIESEDGLEEIDETAKVG